MKKNFKLTIAYEGTAYCGWQVQPNGESIQAVLQKTLETLLKHPVHVTGSGRTDAGVHAQGQVAHFFTETPLNTTTFLHSINGLLPKDIRVQSLLPMTPSFHARYSAIKKIYHYNIDIGAHCNPLTRRFFFHTIRPINKELLIQGAEKFLGTHDFTSFTNEADRGSAKNGAVRTIDRIDIIYEKDSIRLEFEGKGFLYKMIRNIVGTLLHLSWGKISLDDIDTLFAKKDRKCAPMPAPAHGLTLEQVLYPEEFSLAISSNEE